MTHTIDQADQADQADEAEIEREAGKDDRDAQLTFGATVFAAASISFAYWFLILRPGYSDINIGLQFSATGERLTERLAAMGNTVSLSDARAALGSGILFSVLWGSFGCALLWRYWQKAWKAGSGRRTPGKPLGLIFGAGGATVAVVEKLLTLAIGRVDGDGVRFVDAGA